MSVSLVTMLEAFAAMSVSLVTMLEAFAAMSEEEIESAAMSELFVAMSDVLITMLELLLLIAIACAPISKSLVAIFEELVAIAISCVAVSYVVCPCNCPAESSRIALGSAAKLARVKSLLLFIFFMLLVLV